MSPCPKLLPLCAYSFLTEEKKFKEPVLKFKKQQQITSLKTTKRHPTTIPYLIFFYYIASAKALKNEKDMQ